jgi:hypothetical protein
MKCQNKEVLLLMDNFSAHELGVEQIIEKGELTHTKVSISSFLKTSANLHFSLDHVASS